MIVTPAQNEEILVGTGVVDQTVTVEKVVIPFETEVIEDASLPAGQRKEIQAGKVGLKEIKTIQPTLNGQANGLSQITKEVISSTIKQIIIVGTGAASEDSNHDVKPDQPDEDKNKNQEDPNHADNNHLVDPVYVNDSPVQPETKSAIKVDSANLKNIQAEAILPNTGESHPVLVSLSAFASLLFGTYLIRSKKESHK